MPAPKDPAKRALWKRRIGDASRGRKPSAETLRKRGAAISRAKLGVPRPNMRGDNHPMRRPEVVAKFKGPKNGRYVEIPTYGGTHDRLNAQRGRAGTHGCEVCGGSAHHWAMLHEATDLVGDAQGRHYSLDLDEYLPMCRSCHKRYDNGSLVLEELMTCG